MNASTTPPNWTLSFSQLRGKLEASTSSVLHDRFAPPNLKNPRTHNEPERNAPFAPEAGRRCFKDSQKKKKHNVQIHCQTSLYSQRHRNGNPIWGFHYSYNKSKTTYFESMVGCPFFLFFSALANTTKHYFALSILHIEFSNYYLLFFTCFLSSSDFPCYYNTISISKIYFFL